MLYLPTSVRLGTVGPQPPWGVGRGQDVAWRRTPPRTAGLLGPVGGSLLPFPACSHSLRCQPRGRLSPRVWACAATFGPLDGRMACLTLLVPASTLWGPGRRLSAPPPHTRRSATTARGCPPFRPTHERLTFSAAARPRLTSVRAVAGELLRFL